MLSLLESRRSKPASIDHEFEDLKPLMEELYMKQGMTQQQVSRIMETQYGLKATKHRYEKAFRNWNWSKNVPSYFWDSLCLNLYHLEDHGKTLEVFHNGSKIDDERIKREMNRRPTSFFRNHGAPTMLPSGLVILARTDRESVLFFQLPFHAFEACVTAPERLEFGIWPAIDPPENGLSRIVLPHSNLIPVLPARDVGTSITSPAVAWFQTSSCKKSLEAVTSPILSSIQLSGTLTIRLGTNFAMTEHHWQTLLSISNNFAGLADLKGLDALEFFRFWRNEMRQSFTSMIHRASRRHTMRSLLCNILRASVHVGDAETIDFILGCGNNMVDVNSLVCFQNGLACTALEKAAFLSHKDVTRVLLHHGANIWTEGSKQESHLFAGLVRFLVEYFVDVEGCSRSEKISRLIRASGMITCASLIRLIKQKLGDLVQALIEANKVVDIEKCLARVMHYALIHLDENTCIELLRKLDSVTSDINHLFATQTSLGSGAMSSTLLDLAVKKGFTNIAEQLLRRGAVLGPFTLENALSNKNHELVLLLLNNGARIENVDVDQCSYDERCARSEGQKIFPNHTSNNKSVNTADNDKACLLVMAIKNGRIEEAQRLIDCGAELNIIIGDDGPPLYEALKRRDADLIHLLLDAGASPDWALDNGPKVSALSLAVYWGDRTVIEALLDATCSKYGPSFYRLKSSPEALGVAVQKSEKELVRLLLHSYLEIDKDLCLPSIQIAIRKNDVEMMRLLLSSGAWLTTNTNNGIFGKEDAQPRLVLFNLDHHEPGTAYPYHKHSLCRSCMAMMYPLERGGLPNVHRFDRPAGREEELCMGVGNDDWSENYGVYLRELPGGWLIIDFRALLPDEPQPFPTITKQVPEDPMLDELYRWIDDIKQYGKDRQLDLTQCDAKICDLVLDAHKLRCPEFYQTQIIYNLNNLVWTTKYDQFADLIDKRFDMDTVCTHSKKFMNMYYDAIARAKYGNLSFVKKLLEHGVNPQTLIYDGRHFEEVHLTAFLGAIATGKIDVVKLFVEHGADVNLPPRLSVKRTPIQQAAAYGYQDIVHLLITLGADVNAPAARFGGHTAIQLAALGGFNAIINLLITYGADVNTSAAKVNGRTALEGAAEHGRLDTVKVLLNAGAAHNGKDRAEIESAMKYADRMGHPYISDMLKEYLEHGEIEFQAPRADEEMFDAMFGRDRWDENAISIE